MSKVHQAILEGIHGSPPTGVHNSFINSNMTKDPVSNKDIIALIRVE